MTRHDWIVLISILVIIATMVAFYFYARAVWQADLPTWAKIRLILN